MAALGENEQLARVGCAADNRDRVFGAEQLVLDPTLGEWRQTQQQPRVIVINHGAAPGALAAGIGAFAPAPLSRNRSSLPASLASASALASDGSRRATVTGIVWLLAAKPEAFPTAMTSRFRATARVCACPLPLVWGASTVTRSPGASWPASACIAGTASVSESPPPPPPASAAAGI